jgi:branched-chain amino acid aminotransferase
LKGITREVVMEIARPHFELVEEPLRYEELGRVDEAFLTSTTKEILPVVLVDDRRIGAGAPGPNTQRMMALFRDYVEATTRIVV